VSHLCLSSCCCHCWDAVTSGTAANASVCLFSVHSSDVACDSPRFSIHTVHMSIVVELIESMQWCST